MNSRKDKMARILIIEDNPTNMKLAVMLLRNAGHTALSAVDAETGLNMARSNQPDLILMDIQLPGMDGLTATALLKSDPPTAAIPVIALTAMAMKADEEKSQVAGCDAYIAKPFHYQELYAAIDTLLSKGGPRAAGEASPFDPDLASHAAYVLVVDDDSKNRKLLEMWLREDGYSTRGVDSGEAALAAIAHRAPDLVLLDVVMPGMDGNEVARILKAERATASIPIIMVTMHGARDARLAGLKAGAEELLTRPVDRTELSLRVRNLLRFKTFSDFFRDYNWILEHQVLERTADLQRFRTAMDATADGIFLVNRSTMRFFEVNTTACNLLGYTRAELIGSSPSLFATLTLEQLESTYDDIIAGHGTTDFSETKVRLKDGSELDVEVHRQAQRSGADWIIVSVMRDITARKEAEKHLHHLAHYDTLTGLPNRTLFYQTLRKTLAQASDSGWQVAVLFIDLDRFKTVNDTLGHAIGDELLDQFSNRLIQCVRIRDTVGRLGGDEFAMIIAMADGPQGATAVANKIREVLRAPFKLLGHEVKVTASVGITVYPDDASDPATLVKYADTAMYQAKQAGRDTFRFFTAEMNSKMMARLDLEAALRKAVENDEFVLHYQPKVQLASGRIAGLEALLRWQRPGHGMVSPRDFIPVLEDTGLIVQVGRWVIGEACRQIGQWMRGPIGPVQISVNVSGRQFIEGEVNGDVRWALQENDVTADLLELELTESSLMVNTERTIATLQDLKMQGVKISIDDFGTGYSSLAYLRRFPIDKLKIDMAFIREVTSNPDDAVIVLAIISMARSLKLEVIAEGVETAAQLAYLRRHHCDQIQGYYFSPPLALPELECLLREKKGLAPPAGQIRTSRNTVLLVNAEPAGLTSLELLLRQDGYHILAAPSIAEGFELLAMHQVQVVLCDQRMPAMRGTDFLDQVKDLYPDTFRIVLSCDTDPEPIMDAINRGVIHRSYTRAIDNKVLRDNIREALRRYWLLATV